MSENHNSTTDPTDDRSLETEPVGEAVMLSRKTVVPDELRDEPLWVLWNGERKVPIAPWASGHLWWTEWHGELPRSKRPETDYTTAERYANVRVDDLLADYWIPDDAEPHAALRPTIILPPEGGGTDRTELLMYIDFDDVRDPETGEVSPEVAELVDRLNSYTELSSSGTGLHILVYATLPDVLGAIPGEPLDGHGSIEIYDHGRFLGGTWEHVDGTLTEINERQGVVDEIIECYAAERLERERAKSAGASRLPRSRDRDRDLDRNGRRGRSGSGSASSGDRSEYFDAELSAFARPETVERSYPGGEQGPHPDHGKTTSGAVSLNYNLDTEDNRWHCFAHSSGGGPLEMAAVMADVIECRDAGRGTLDGLSNDDYLQVCLYARDTLDGFTDDMTPPYRALVAVAKRYDLSMADAETGVLGPTTHKFARTIYNELTLDDLN